MENPKIRFKGFTKDWEQRKLGKFRIMNNQDHTLLIVPIMIIVIQHLF